MKILIRGLFFFNSFYAAEGLVHGHYGWMALSMLAAVLNLVSLSWLEDMKKYGKD